MEKDSRVVLQRRNSFTNKKIDFQQEPAHKTRILDIIDLVLSEDIPITTYYAPQTQRPTAGTAVH